MLHAQLALGGDLDQREASHDQRQDAFVLTRFKTQIQRDVGQFGIGQRSVDLRLFLDLRNRRTELDFGKVHGRISFERWYEGLTICDGTKKPASERRWQV